jgi:hypothetical protein
MPCPGRDTTTLEADITVTGCRAGYAGHDVRHTQAGRKAGVAHGTQSRWLEGCDCEPCRLAMNAAAKARFRAKAQARLPGEVQQRLLDAIYAGQPFRTVLRDLDLTPNQVWGLAKTDEGWSTALESALLATRRDDLEHGTNAAYVAGCVCRECREHQRVRMARIVSS